MPKRWKIVSASGTAGVGAAGGGEGGGGQSRKVKIELYLEKDGPCVTLPWEWESKREAREAIEASDEKGWKTAKVDD